MRGMSILGIFLVNMLSFHSPILYIDPWSTWTDSLNRGIYAFIDVFIQGSVYPMFSFLFGYGFVLLRERTFVKGERFLFIAIRRLLFLMLIGWLHAKYIWHGDILFTYAVFGLLLLVAIRLSAKALIILGSLLFVIPNLLFTVLLVISSLIGGDGVPTVVDEQSAAASYETYQSGSFQEISAQRFEDWYLVNSFGNLIFMLFSIFSMFLIGAGAAKSNWLRRVKEFKRGYIILTFLFFFMGVIIKSLPYLMKRNLATGYAQDMLGGPLLAFVFIFLITLLTNTDRGFQRLKMFEPVGKLSLSNYLFQSLLSTMIFYSYGLGFYGKMSVAGGTLLALSIFIFQMIASHFWVKKFLYGPFEWVWRSVTYWKIQNINRLER